MCVLSSSLSISPSFFFSHFLFENGDRRNGALPVMACHVAGVWRQAATPATVTAPVCAACTGDQLINMGLPNAESPEHTPKTYIYKSLPVCGCLYMYETVRVCVCACRSACAGARERPSACVGTRFLACLCKTMTVHACESVNMCVFTSTRVQVCECVYTRLCMRARTCMRMHACVGACACVPVHVFERNKAKKPTVFVSSASIWMKAAAGAF